MSAGVNALMSWIRSSVIRSLTSIFALSNAPLHEKLEIGRVVRLRAFTPFRDTAGFEPPIVRARLEDRDIPPRQ
jgi:hypothetical protein